MNEINLRRAGRGEPLLLIHGIGGHLHVWDPVFETLARARDTIAVDLPGFGDSAALTPGVEPSPAVLAGTLGRALDELGLTDAHLVGNSLGAWVALEMARQGRARSVVAVCPAGLWKAPLLGADDAAHNLSRRVALRARPVLRLLLATPSGRRLIFSRFMVHPERLTVDQAQRMLDAFVSAPAYEATNEAMRRRRVEGMEEITVPVTVAWGAGDRVVRRSTRVPPRSRVVDLPGCGHIPMWDDPELVAELLLRTSSITADATD